MLTLTPPALTAIAEYLELHADAKVTGRTPCGTGWVGTRPKPGCKRAKKGTEARKTGVKRKRMGKAATPAKAKPAPTREQRKAAMRGSTLQDLFKEADRIGSKYQDNPKITDLGAARTAKKIVDESMGSVKRKAMGVADLGERRKRKAEGAAIIPEVLPPEPAPKRKGLVARLKDDIATLKTETEVQKKATARILGAAAQMSQNQEKLIDEVVDMVEDDLKKQKRIKGSRKRRTDSLSTIADYLALHADARTRKSRKQRRRKKISEVMREYKAGELNSGSKKGPVVTNRKQAIAIALSKASKVDGMEHRDAFPVGPTVDAIVSRGQGMISVEFAEMPSPELSQELDELYQRVSPYADTMTTAAPQAGKSFYLTLPDVYCPDRTAEGIAAHLEGAYGMLVMRRVLPISKFEKDMIKEMSPKVVSSFAKEAELREMRRDALFDAVLAAYGG